MATTNSAEAFTQPASPISTTTAASKFHFPLVSVPFLSKSVRKPEGPKLLFQFAFCFAEPDLRASSYPFSTARSHL